MTRAVIFDFSGTLFHCEDTESWLRGALRQAGLHASDAQVAEYAPRLHASGGQPGGYADFPVPAHSAEAWAQRDLTPENHRAAYTALIDEVGLPWPGLADVLYERHLEPDAWHPYPDSVAVLELLAGRAVPVAVLSNIGWDLRSVFEHHKIGHLIATYVLSYEIGVKKPDPRIFQMACDLLGHAPADVLMVGDDRVADAGATAIGCEFRAVDHLPVADRAQALLDAVASR
jgi:FMN phosphatase YigB (HAD superfamily)